MDELTELTELTELNNFPKLVLGLTNTPKPVTTGATSRCGDLQNLQKGSSGRNQFLQ